MMGTFTKSFGGMGGYIVGKEAGWGRGDGGGTDGERPEAREHVFC